MSDSEKPEIRVVAKVDHQRITALIADQNRRDLPPTRSTSTAGVQESEVVGKIQPAPEDLAREYRDDDILQKRAEGYRYFDNLDLSEQDVAEAEAETGPLITSLITTPAPVVQDVPDDHSLDAVFDDVFRPTLTERAWMWWSRTWHSIVGR